MASYRLMEKFNEAEAYERIFAPNWPTKDGDSRLEMLELLAPEKGNKVLDIGCGTGAITKIIADRVGPEGKVVAN